MLFNDINIGDVFVKIHGSKAHYLCVGKSINIEEGQVINIVHLLNIKYPQLPKAIRFEDFKEFTKAGHEDLSGIKQILDVIKEKYV